MQDSVRQITLFGNRIPLGALLARGSIGWAVLARAPKARINAYLYRRLRSKMRPRAMSLMVSQLSRFCSVGALCLAVSTAVLAALHELAGMYYLAAYAISFCVGNLLGYLLNGRFTFSTRVSASGGARYLFLNAALLAVSSLLMKLLVDGAHVWYMFAFLMLALANTPISFLLHRRFSYVQPSRRGPLSQLSGSAQ